MEENEQSGSPAKRTSPAPSNDLIFVSIDTQRADRLGVYGYKHDTTPNLDAFAEEAVVFEDHHAQSSLTLPSHVSILTGLNPPNHGVRNNGKFRLTDRALTLAEILGDAGYSTAAIISAGVLSPIFGLNQGFDFYDGDFSGLDDKTQTDAAAATRRAVAWLEKRRKDERLFLFVHYYDPHPPFSAPPRFRFDHGYDAEVAFVDEQIGKLFSYLEKIERFEDALIVVTSDHGESLGEHAVLGHTIVLYEQTLHIPLLVRFPGAKHGGERVDRLTRNIDLMPTLLSHLGLRPPERIDGASLLSSIGADSSAPEPSSYAETFYAPMVQLHQKSIIDDGWKLISFFTIPPGTAIGRYIESEEIRSKTLEPVPPPMRPNYVQLIKSIPKARALFDLRSDREERVNLYFEKPREAKRLERLLDGMRAAVPGERFVPKRNIVEQLRSLGYLQLRSDRRL
ncbi:MAG: sulfatase [Polyangia bacterium]